MSHQNPSDDLKHIARPGGRESATTDTIELFRVAIPQAALDDLNDRLSKTRWPSAQTVDDWRQGVPLLNARALVEY